MALAPADDELLTFVAALPNPTSPAAQAKIHNQFGNVTRAWQRINAVIDTPDAMAAHPTVCGQLRRVRDNRRTARGSNRALT